MKTNPCFRKRILSSQQVAKIQIRLNLGGFLGRQSFVAETKVFSKIFCNPFAAATCRRELLPQLVPRPVHKV